MRPWTLLTVLVLGVSLSPAVESDQTVQEAASPLGCLCWWGSAGSTSTQERTTIRVVHYSRTSTASREAPTAT